MLTEGDSEKEGSIKHQKLYLKPLLVELPYAYLEKGEQCLVVIFALLNASQESGLLDILKKYRQAIRWKISNLKGISPLVNTHHIYMEEESKLVR